jgi:hypothetical protein
MPDIIIKVLVFYCLVLFVWLLSVVLVVNEGWKRNGFIQPMEQSRETAKELVLSPHWTSRFFLTMNAVAFFYYCVPVSLYQRFVKGNKYATLNDPRGKHPELTGLK